MNMNPPLPDPSQQNDGVQANAAIRVSDAEAAILAITALAERLFAFYPFAPDPFPDNWRAILRCWLLGQPLAGLVAGLAQCLFATVCQCRHGSQRDITPLRWCSVRR